MVPEKKVSASRSIMTEMIMPNDTNPIGNLMGGNLMRWMDIIAAICANRHAEAFCVTASVDHISFHKPVRLGQVITLEAQVSRVFNTSMEVFVEAFMSDSRSIEKELANHAYFSFVALDESTLKPKKIMQVVPETEKDQKLFENAQARREMRMLLSGRLEAKNAKTLKELIESNKLIY